MRILMLGGTRFFGKYAVRTALEHGHSVTIATRGLTADDFGDSVQRIHLDRLDPASLRNKLSGQRFDAVIDNICYCSNDVRSLLDAVDCNRYVMTSSASVYVNRSIIRECDFDPLTKPLVWCDRDDFSYEEIKQQAECALFQQYAHISAAAVRYPYVIGPDDYTNRLRFYVEHVVRGIPMHIDNLDSRIGFIRAEDAGAFLVHLAERDFRGGINGSNSGVFGIGEILTYVQQKTGKIAVLTPDGEPAPYNGETDYSMNTALAESTGFTFPPIRPWIYTLLDHYIDQCQEMDV